MGSSSNSSSCSCPDLPAAFVEETPPPLNSLGPLDHKGVISGLSVMFY